MRWLGRLPRWATISAACACAAVLFVLSEVSDGRLPVLVIAALFAALAIALPQLQQWQIEQDARLRITVEFDPPSLTIPAFAAGADPVIEGWLGEEENRCLASLRSDQAPARDTFDYGRTLPGDDDPLRGLTVGDLRRLVERQAAGEELTEDEQRALEAYRKTARYLTANVGRSVADLMAGAVTAPDDRTAEQYEQHVTHHLEACGKHIRAWLTWRYATCGIGRLRARLVNPTDKVFEKVQLELHLLGDVRAVDPDELREPPNRMPGAPRPFGERRTLPQFGISMPHTLTAADSPTVDLPSIGLEIDNSASARVRYRR